MVRVILNIIIGTIVGSAVLIITKKDEINNIGMRFFRDLGRIKSRRRRYGKDSTNAVALLLGNEQLLDIELLRQDDKTQQEQIIVDIEELKSHNGKECNSYDESFDDNKNNNSDDPNKCTLWLSIQNRVYDVTSGWKFYGPPKGKYHGFVGKDATRAFCTGCLLEECLISNTTGLSEQQILESYKWIEYYELHDKYKFVGILQNVTGHIDELVDEALLETEATEYESGGLKITPEMLMG